MPRCGPAYPRESIHGKRMQSDGSSVPVCRSCADEFFPAGWVESFHCGGNVFERRSKLRGAGYGGPGNSAGI